MPTRPTSIGLSGFDGAMFTLPQNAAHYEPLSSVVNGPLLLLGYGPNPEELPFVRQQAGREVYCFQSPGVERMIAEARLAERFRPPEGATIVGAEEAARLCGRSACYFYKPCLRLDPDFWGPFLGQMEARKYGAAKRARVAFLPGDCSQLLHQEMRLALQEAGFDVFYGDPGAPGIEAAGKPNLLLSINFRGLDRDGRIFNLHRALDVPVAIWLVDNPWHLLSGIRLPWWKDAHIFVTDASFIPQMEEEGAKNVHFLPLAAAQHMFAATGAGDGPPVFVGRSAFPERERYFAAAKYPEELAREAERLFERGEAPDFHWWRMRLPCRLWPGHDARKIGHGAENCARRNRQRWLAAGVARSLRIYGDADWKNLLPGAEILPPVDYYGQLPQIYASARAVLNVTSLLLPESLSQRHFDVWAANGLLLSDATRGLEIFPEDLIRPMRLARPDDLAERLDYFASRPAERRELIHAWREHVQSGHLYSHRLAIILKTLGVEN